jgi:hypothetical protein
VELKDKLKKLAVSMISAHQEFSFKNMGILMDQSEILKNDTFFTKDKFNEVCEKLKEKCGEMKSVEYIGSLDKGESLQTLWKVKYTKTEQEMLWQMTVVNHLGAYKIVSMSVN